MKGFGIAGDIKLADDERQTIRVTGIERVRARLSVLLGIASGSYEYTDIGIKYGELIGARMNEGLLKEEIRSAAMSDPDVEGVSSMVVTYRGNRAYSLSMVVIVKGVEHKVNL